MGGFEASKPVAVVQAINEQRGCPYAMDAATQMGSLPVDAMSPNDRKAEYYFLLDDVLAGVMDVVHGYQERFDHGLVMYDENQDVVSGLAAMKQRVAPHVAAGSFSDATYWAHDAIHRTVAIATEQWLAHTDTDSVEYRRINSLVDDPRQAAYGNVAVQKRVSSAANQAVNISCSYQRLTDHHFRVKEGRDITQPEMIAAHEGNLRFAMPMTQLHLYETRPMREVLGTLALPGSSLEVYTEEEFFVYDEGALHPAGLRMVDKLAHYPGQFPDGRIGCPGAKYVPEIWAWTGRVSAQFAMPALKN